jgi:hypothetical protein
MIMSLETAAETVAAEIRRHEFVEVYAHHDADGIAAGSILCHAMLRAGIQFRLRVRQEITYADVAGDSTYLLCDIGSGMEELPEDTIVIDHHLPKFSGGFHANPRLEGTDGDRELSAAGTAYIVAQQLGDNRDLAGLVIPGIIGDGQEITGRNLDIFNEGVANGIIVPDRGITLPGRDMAERWYMATRPYLDKISGSENLIAGILEDARDKSKDEKALRLDVLLSSVVLEAALTTSPSSLLAVYGDTYHLHREVIEDAHTLTAIIDACGKAGYGDIGATLCLRSSHYLDNAWEIARKHHLNVINAVRTARITDGRSGVYEIQDASVASDVADIFSRDQVTAMPVLVYARSGNICRISARSPAGTVTQLGPLFNNLAAACGGNGGGHVNRAGAAIPCDRIAAFTKGWQEAFAS